MNTNTHPVDQEEVMAHLDGELSAERAAAVAGHLEHCEECQRLAADLGSVSQKMLTWNVESPEVTLPSGRDAMANKIKPFDWRVWFRTRPLAPLAVGFAMCLAIVVTGIRSIGTNANQVFDQRGEKLSAATQQTQQFDKLDQFAKLQKPPAVVFKTAPSGIVRGSDAGGGARPDLSSYYYAADKSEPMVIRTAALTVTVQELDKARTSLDEILKRHRGHVGDLQAASPPGDGRTLKATLRIPADQLDATLVELKKLGRVDSESQNGQEVTAEYVDLQARLANSRNTEQRLTDVLKQRTGKLSDVLEVETEIARVRGEIESMEAQRKSMANQVAFATLTATLTEDYKPKLQAVPPSALMQFRNATVDGYKSMTDGVVGLAVFLLSYGPSLILWGGLLFFPVRGILRRFVRNEAR